MKLKINLFVALAIVALVCSCSNQVAQGEAESKTYTGTIPEMIEEFYQDNKAMVAGALVGVFDSEGIIHKGYYGYQDGNTATRVDENTVMDWGSATKTLVWVSVMQLYEQGKIDLKADIKTYLPEGFLTNLRYEKPITMIDLMNHRAGFQEYYYDIMKPIDEPFLSLEEALQVEQPAQVFEPDTLTGYSNWGVALAGYIVERISGMSFCDYAHENIFKPLDMKDTAIAPDLTDNLSVRERREQLMCYAPGPIGNAFNIIQLYPAGSCVSTLDDFIKFGSCFVKEKFPLFERQETFDEMISATSFLGNSDVTKNAHGFWAQPYGVNTLGHGGNTQACSSNLVFNVSEGLGVVVLTNRAGEGVFNDKMMRVIFGENDWELSIPAELPNGLLRPARTALEGRYKILGESFTTPDAFIEVLWTYNENDGIKKIESPYSDYYFVSLGECLPTFIGVYGWVIAIVFSVIALLVALIRRIVRAIRKKEKRKMPRWTFWACVIQIVIAVVAVLFVLMFTSFQSVQTYGWTFKAIVALGAVLLLLVALGLVRLVKTWKDTKLGGKIFQLTTALFGFITVFAIVWEQLWR